MASYKPYPALDAAAPAWLPSPFVPGPAPALDATTPAWVPPDLAHLEKLRSLQLSTATLEKKGFPTEKLTVEQLELKKRCEKCNSRIKVNKSNAHKKYNRPSNTENQPLQPDTAQQDSSPQQADTQVGANDPSGENKPKSIVCKFHPGKHIKVRLPPQPSTSVVQFRTDQPSPYQSGQTRIWTCCGKHISSAPCSSSSEHRMPRDPANNIVRNRWQFHYTPQNPLPTHLDAVAIDCEMGTAYDGDTELIRISAIDYFKGTTLIDSLVCPDVPMQHYNTKWSGVTKADMEQAKRDGSCIWGREAAREALFNFVGPSTIVVGHGLQNDFSSLRWIHGAVVDSFMIESALRDEEKKKAEEEEKKRKAAEETMGGGDKDASVKEKDAAAVTEKRGKGSPDGMSLKALTQKLLSRSIQTGKGHCSLEDAIAARDLVHFYLTELGRPIPPI